MYKKIIFSLMSGIASLGLMCADVEAANPVGSVQVATSAATNQLHVRGTAYDPDDMSRPVRLHVYVGGTPG